MDVLAIVGPTASGKSEIAEAVAEQYGATIVSVDSMQVYRGMNIGTAKPSQEMRGRIPHRMIDIADASEEVSVKGFQAIGRSAMSDVLDRGGRIVIAGGSGLHLRALVDPLTFAPTDANLRAELEEVDAETLRARLIASDPSAAAHVDLANPRRVIRAVEVFELVGTTPSERAASSEARAVARYEPLIPFIGVGVDAGDDVNHRIVERVHRMLDAGLVEEVTELDGRLGATAGQALGYKELLTAVRGECELAEAVDAVITGTRALVKRQRTYFRRDPRIAWLTWQDDTERRLADAVAVVGERMSWTS